jgi:hypothetical protein
MKRVWLVAALLVAIVGGWRVLDADWGERAALCADSAGWEVGGLPSGPVSSEEPPPLLHLGLDLLDFFRRVFGVCFWGVVGPLRPWGVGSESRDDDEVNSGVDSVVEEPKLAMAVAWGCPLDTEKKAGRFGAGEACAPLFGDDAG